MSLFATDFWYTRFANICEKFWHYSIFRVLTLYISLLFSPITFWSTVSNKWRAEQFKHHCFCSERLVSDCQKLQKKVELPILKSYSSMKSTILISFNTVSNKSLSFVENCSITNYRFRYFCCNQRSPKMPTKVWIVIPLTIQSNLTS